MRAWIGVAVLLVLVAAAVLLYPSSPLSGTGLVSYSQSGVTGTYFVPVVVDRTGPHMELWVDDVDGASNVLASPPKEGDCGSEADACKFDCVGMDCGVTIKVFDETSGVREVVYDCGDGKGERTPQTPTGGGSTTIYCDDVGNVEDDKDAVVKVEATDWVGNEMLTKYFQADEKDCTVYYYDKYNPGEQGGSCWKWLGLDYSSSNWAASKVIVTGRLSDGGGCQGKTLKLKGAAEGWSQEKDMGTVPCGGERSYTFDIPGRRVLKEQRATAPDCISYGMDWMEVRVPLDASSCNYGRDSVLLDDELSSTGELFIARDYYSEVYSPWKVMQNPSCGDKLVMWVGSELVKCDTASAGSVKTTKVTSWMHKPAAKSFSDYYLTPPVGNKPVAVFSETGTTTKISFDASASYDYYGSITTYSWDFGDKTTLGSGKTVDHTYAGIGTYNVILTVTDDKGNTGSSSFSLELAATSSKENAVRFTGCVSIIGGSSGVKHSEGEPVSYAVKDASTNKFCEGSVCADSAQVC
jgi:hypothetical protein